MKKIIAGVIMSAIALTMGALVGCSSTPSEEVPDDPAGTKTAVFEAEGCDLSEYSGHGWSNNATGCQTIQGQNTQKIRENQSVLNSISNGYFVGFFGVENTALTFDFTSAEAVEATLVLRLASEWGTMTVDDSIMQIEVNGEIIEYNPFTVTGKKIDSAATVEYGVPFADFTISTKISLKKGDNTIKLIGQGAPFGDMESMDIGPGVDCIKIKSMTDVTWESLWEDNQLNVKEN